MIAGRLGRLGRAVDDRVGAASWVRKALDHVFPDHWSFMLGEAAAYAFIVLLVSGVYLTLFFDASLGDVVYHGSYDPLVGTTMSGAYRSVIDLSFDVPAGLLMRQIHHWAALVFIGLIVVHAGRIFFTGAFRKPREMNWIIGITMLLLALANGFAGYSMVDDLLSGIGLRIAYSVGESIPVVGTWLVGGFFGGEFPGQEYLGRLYIVHVLIVPALIATLLAVHLALVWRQKHTQFPGEHRTERNVVGSRLFPTYAARSIALLFGLAGILVLLGGLVQINPVWLWGPYDPAATTTAAQPDWYVGWLEGALRLFPPWEVRVAGHVVPNPFFPGILMPGIFFVGMYGYPFIERRLTRDRRGHELLDRPRDHPVRTAVGVAVLTYFAVLVVAGSQDVIAAGLDISVQAMVPFLRVAVLVLPLVTAAIAWSWCRGLARATTGSAAQRERVHERWTEEGTESEASGDDGVIIVLDDDGDGGGTDDGGGDELRRIERAGGGPAPTTGTGPGGVSSPMAPAGAVLTTAGPRPVPTSAATEGGEPAPRSQRREPDREPLMPEPEPSWRSRLGTWAAVIAAAVVGVARRRSDR